MGRTPNRSTDTSVFVRCKTSQKRALEEAAAIEAKRVPGAKLPVYTFLLMAGLEKAKALGVDVPDDEQDVPREKRGKTAR